MRRPMRWVLPASLVFGLLACEDGPDQIFSPFDGDPKVQNGFNTGKPFTPEGNKPFEEVGGQDHLDQAKFCSELVTQKLSQWMVQQPIIPDQGAAGVTFWDKDGKPKSIDDLVGEWDPKETKSDDVKFCNPETEYANAFAYGATNPIIIFFNQETRLIETIQITGDYQGALKGEFTRPADSKKVDVELKTRERIKIDGQELDEYTQESEQATKKRSWLNHQNVTAMYRMVRESFFGAQPLSADYDCVKSKVCTVFYSQKDQTIPQNTQINFNDSGVVLVVAPTGQLLAIVIDLMRTAPFEMDIEPSAISFAPGGAPSSSQPPNDGVISELSPKFESGYLENCKMNLNDTFTWGQFLKNCREENDQRTVQRADYSVATQRDGVYVGFNGIELFFSRKTAEKGVLKDGEHPGDTDILQGFSVYRLLDAPIAEFVPAKIAQRFANLLGERLKNEVHLPADICPMPQVPAEITEATAPIRLGKLAKGQKFATWELDVLDQIQSCYFNKLSQAQQAQVSPKILDKNYLIEPMLDAVIYELTHGLSAQKGAVIETRMTDNKKWSLATAHFISNGVPYRMTVQFSFLIGEVVVVSVYRGFNESDDVFQKMHQALYLQAQYPAGLGFLNDLKSSNYYLFEESTFPPEGVPNLLAPNPYALGGNGIKVTGFDRKLNTVDVELALPDGQIAKLKTPGTHKLDNGGCMIQERGERYDFRPGHWVDLNGRENRMSFCIQEISGEDANGNEVKVPEITMIQQSYFKGEVMLCKNLYVTFGQNVRELVTQYRKAYGDQAYNQCEIVFNWSENGNVLKSVTSLANRTTIYTEAERALHAAKWQ